MKRTLRSTVEAAAAAGVPRATLQHWIKTRKIQAPRIRLVGRKAARFWTEADIRRIRQMKGTLQPGPKKSGARKGRR
jgi:DNA-binding transcriptional MerR regulator